MLWVLILEMLSVFFTAMEQSRRRVERVATRIISAPQSKHSSASVVQFALSDMLQLVSSW